MARKSGPPSWYRIDLGGRTMRTLENRIWLRAEKEAAARLIAARSAVVPVVRHAVIGRVGRGGAIALVHVDFQPRVLQRLVDARTDFHVDMRFLQILACPCESALNFRPDASYRRIDFRSRLFHRAHRLFAHMRLRNGALDLGTFALHRFARLALRALGLDMDALPI